MSMVVGCWVHVLLYRRVLFAIMDEVFKAGKGVGIDTVFCLSRKARSELQLLACLGPLAQSDLRVRHSSKIFATDASPTGGAVVFAELSRAATKELWRHTEQRGFYTKLQSPVSEILSDSAYLLKL